MRENHFIPTTAGQVFAVETITSDEFNQLLALRSRRSVSGIRDRALLTVLYRAGLRLQEALDLVSRDIDLDAGSINVRRGKGGRQRIVGLDPGAAAIVEQWLARRRALGLNGQQTVFCLITTGKLGEPMDQSHARHMLKRLASRAGIEKRVHPHCLRHSMASDMLREGIPLNVIQQQLGHSSIATTDRYLRKIAPHELIAAVQQREWSGDR